MQSSLGVTVLLQQGSVYVRSLVCYFFPLIWQMYLGLVLDGDFDMRYHLRKKLDCLEMIPAK